MDLNKISIKKIRELIVFTAFLVVALWKFDVVLGVLKAIWGIIFPFILGGAIAFLPQQKADALLKVCSLTYRIFANFLTGQCLEAVILGCMFVITLSILRMPYALLIGVLIAFTALIPIFGAFIGCAVGGFLIFMVSPKQAILFIIVFLVLQQIEGNLIYPHVVGESVGLPSIWVLAAVTIGGNLMGIVGMLVFIPLLSVFYTIFREYVYLHLKKQHIKRVTTTEIEKYTEEDHPIQADNQRED